MKIVDDEVTISVWYSLSFSHLLLADRLAQLSGEIEEKHEVFSIHPDHDLIKPYALGSVMASVSFLEANINEFLNGLLDKQGGQDVERFIKVKKWWDTNKNNRSLSIIKKYQKSLELAGLRKYGSTDIVLSDTRSLVNLRNRLVHYKPEWITTDSEIDDSPPVSVQSIEDLLSDKFEMCKFHIKSSNPYFPDKCLGYGCTKWSINTSLQFSNSFYQKMDLEPPYKSILKQLTQIKA